MKQESRQLQHKHKTTSIFPAYTFERINEALLHKERVHNFSFGTIKISGGKWTTARNGRRKSALSVNLRFLRFPLQNTSKRRLPPLMFSSWSSSCMGLSSRWAISERLSSVMQGTYCWHVGAWCICGKCNINTCSHIVSLGPIIEPVATGAWAEVQKWRMWTTSGT
jgi:hypothetical protein